MFLHMSNYVEKAIAIEVALLLNASGQDRTFIVELINEAYGNKHILRLDLLGHQLKFLALAKAKEKQEDVSHFMTCLRLECLSLR
jgi:hypothetical protein